jgi:hypothetical protein
LEVAARSAKLRDAMIRATGQSWRWSQWAGPPEKRRGRKITIEYSCLHGPDRAMVYSIARWMRSVAQVIYDGDEDPHGLARHINWFSAEDYLKNEGGHDKEYLRWLAWREKMPHGPPPPPQLPEGRR